MEPIPVPKWDLHLGDGVRRALAVIYEGLQLVVEHDDELMIILDEWLEELKEKKKSTDSLLDFWDAYFWAVGVRRGFANIVNRPEALPWRRELFQIWDSAIRPLIIHKLTLAPAMPDPMDGYDGLWPPEAVARPEPDPEPDDFEPGAAA